MKKLTYSIAGLILAAGAAQAQPADETLGTDAHSVAHGHAAAPADVAAEADIAADVAANADVAADVAATPAELAAPSVTAATLTEAEIDSFAQATVKLQAIQADTALAPEQKSTAMVAAVTEVGLDPAKYNAIGKAAATDATLLVKVQTAMSRHAAPAPGEG